MENNGHLLLSSLYLTKPICTYCFLLSLIVLTMNKKDASKIPPLPLNSSVYSFGSTASINFAKPLLSFPTESSNQVNEEYLANMRQIIESIPIHSFNSTSPSVSTYVKR